MLKIQESTKTCHQTILVVQSSQKIEPRQKLSFLHVDHVKHGWSARPRWFRPTPKLWLAYHLETIAKSWANFKFAGWLLQQPTETGIQSGPQPPIVGCGPRPAPGHVLAQNKREFPLPQAQMIWAWLFWWLDLLGNAANGLWQWKGPKSKFTCNAIQIQLLIQQNNTKLSKNPQINL